MALRFLKVCEFGYERGIDNINIFTTNYYSFDIFIHLYQWHGWK